MFKRVCFALIVFVFVLLAGVSQAAYEARFDAINFDPAVDGGNYNMIYGSKALNAWQGDLGFYFDYANRPLEFRSTGATTGRQSVLDHTFIVDAYGALGFTDWFTAGINLPIVAYNIFYTDDVAAQADKGAGMGDVMLMAKFRILDIEKLRFGFAVIPYVTLPTGDIVRYNGSGHVTGGLKLAFDAKLHERFELALNLGALMRDDVTRNYVFAGGATSTVRVDDLFTFGLGMNIKFSRQFQAIIETHGTTVFRNFFSTRNVTSLEADGGVRYFFGNSGFALDAGGGAGLIEGIGTPRFRGYLGLRWKSPIPEECAPAPDPRIKDNKIVLWGKIFFDTAKATIKPISYPVLDDVVDVLNSHPEITFVEVQGHTDFRGSDSYNLDLSQRRATSAMNYLIGKGISASRLTAKGYGESQPIASNDTIEGMSQNRRVDFVIMQSTGGYTSNPNAIEMNTSTSGQKYAPVEQVGDVTTPVTTPTQETTPTVTESPVTTPASNNNDLTNQKDTEGNYLPNYSS